MCSSWPYGKAVAHCSAPALCASAQAQINDATVFAATQVARPAVLESMELSGWGYHNKDEFIEIDAIVPRLYLTARMLQDLAKNPVR